MHSMTRTCLALGLLLATAAHAEIEVTRSTTRTIKVGAKFPDGATLQVPAGTEIDVLKTPEKTTHTIKGAHSGTLSAYLNPCPAWKALIGSCKSAGEAIDEGGTRGAPMPGATRGIRMPDAR